METILEQCADDGSGYEEVSNCHSEALCDPTAGECLPPACEPDAGAGVCLDARLFECSEDLTTLRRLDTCDSAQLCDERNAECDVCIAGKAHCDGDTRVVCDADGQRSNRIPCTDATPFCNDGRCVECTSSLDCGSANPTCDNGTCTSPGIDAGADAG